MSASISGRRAAAGVAAASIAMLIVGCTAQAAETPPAAETAPTNLPVADAPIEAVSSVGPTEYPGIGFPIPEYARSLAIDFECAGGAPFSVELGDSMMLGQTPLDGTCDGTTALAWPVTDRTAPTLSVLIADGVEWSATFDFSENEFEADDALAAECEQFSMSLSALYNADNGLLIYKALDAAEWAERVALAGDELSGLVASSRTELGEALEALRALATDPNLAPGFLETAGAEAPRALASQLCGANQTPVFIVDEFGG